ncbi:MAG: DNA polymerase III subunit gamma/tau [bacterium]|nr:DNA polymerase III subunit gamma/tau [bacterium]
MAYLVLARKYRPRSFSEVAGQEVVTRVLAGAIQEDRIGHAYLFTGPRGTGKTTSARLFAKALNCDQGPTPEPCGTCDRCESIDAGNEVDVIEIDAASNTGVDNVRELREQAGYVPMRARFKIYIIDEVHMLSKSAFNALLKTLEEPPPHVKFLFATTDPHKVLDTIVSRCQVLKLSPLPEATIAARLDVVFEREGVEAGEGVSAELARRARGGMRDALSMADQLLALVGMRPSLADCERLASEGSSATVEAVVEHVAAGRGGDVLSTLPPEGDEAQFLSALLDHLRGVLIACLCGPDAPMLPASAAGGPDGGKALAERGARIGARRLELWLQELLFARERMRLLPAHARLILEVTLLELCQEESTLPLADFGQRLEALESRLAGGAPPLPRAAAPQPAPAPAPTAAAAPAPSSAPAADSELEPRPRPASAPAPRPPVDTSSSDVQGLARPRVTTNSTADAWSGFLDELAIGSRGLSELLRKRGNLVGFGDGAARVKLTGLTDDERPMISDKRNRRACEKAFSTALGRAIELVLEDATDARHGKEDPFTREVADLFEGRIEE